MKPSDYVILVVDDEKDLRDSIAYDFSRKQFQVLQAACGVEALEVIRKNKVDVVLSDVRMPNGTGLELLDWIKAIDSSMPVLIFVTAYADITLAEAYDRGADSVFSKPFDRKALLEAVVNAIHHQSQPFRRGSVRVATEIAAGVTFLAEGHTFPGRIRNFGRGGFFVELEGTMPEKEGGQVEFRLPALGEDGQEIIGTGIVRWVRRNASGDLPAGCGIEFCALGEDSRREVLNLLNYMKTKSYIPLK